jgi:hypothetical protein
VLHPRHPYNHKRRTLGPSITVPFLFNPAGSGDPPRRAARIGARHTILETIDPPLLNEGTAGGRDNLVVHGS